MKNQPKVVLDFNQGISDHVAIIPANIALLAMQMYKENLRIAQPQQIVGAFSDRIFGILNDNNPNNMVVRAISEAETFIETTKFNEMITSSIDFREFDVETKVSL